MENGCDGVSQGQARQSPLWGENSKRGWNSERITAGCCQDQCSMAEIGKTSAAWLADLIFFKLDVLISAE